MSCRQRTHPILLATDYSPLTAPMPTEVKLPNLGDGIDSGDVLELLVKEGETIAQDQGILEIETGKATMQVPSPTAGKVLKVHVAQGQTIPIGAVLLTLEGAAAASLAPKEQVSPKQSPPKQAPPKQAPPKSAAQPPASKAPAAPQPA